MAPSTYQSVILSSRPNPVIVPGETFTLKTNPMLRPEDLKENEVLVETLYISLDPAMRMWLNGKNPFFSSSIYSFAFLFTIKGGAEGGGFF